MSLVTYKKLQKHKYVRLIEYTLDNSTFSPNSACVSCGLSEKEFQFISRSIYCLNAYQDQMIHPREKQDWVLQPEAYFSYLQFLEFRHAVKVANWSFWLSVIAIVVTLAGSAIALAI